MSVGKVAMIDMKKTIVFLLLPVMFHAMKADAAKIEEEKGTLVCGDAVAEATTKYYDDASDIVRQVIQQTIVVTNSRKNIKKKLRLDSKVIYKPTFGRILLDSKVSGWACLKADDGRHYIYLWYSCLPADGRGFCEDERAEWDRLFQTDGKALTRSFRRYDKRYETLYEKLELHDVMKKGFRLQSTGTKME